MALHLSNTNTYPSATAHDSIEKLFENVYWVHGSIRVGPSMTMNRNMVIIKSPEGLTLVNPVRLNIEEEQKLLALGDIKVVMRLGDFHGLDDQYYVDKFQAQFWCQSGQSTYKTPLADTIINEDTKPTIANAEFFIFSSSIYPEAALFLKDCELLITTDSIQNLTDWSYTTLFTQLMLKLMGFKLDLIIGKPWLKRVTPKGTSLCGDFERLLKLDFKHIIAAHGTPLKDTAKEQLKQVMSETFKEYNSVV
jgi:hypothetical protein